MNYNWLGEGGQGEWGIASPFKVEVPQIKVADNISIQNVSKSQLWAYMYMLEVYEGSNKSATTNFKQENILKHDRFFIARQQRYTKYMAKGIETHTCIHRRPVINSSNCVPAVTVQVNIIQQCIAKLLLENICLCIKFIHFNV